MSWVLTALLAVVVLYTIRPKKPRPPVELRPIRHLSTDLRDHHLVARWHRLCRRWRKV